MRVTAQWSQVRHKMRQVMEKLEQYSDALTLLVDEIKSVRLCRSLPRLDFDIAALVASLFRLCAASLAVVIVVVVDL
jgi:hypothetical protein